MKGTDNIGDFAPSSNSSFLVYASLLVPRRFLSRIDVVATSSIQKIAIELIAFDLIAFDMIAHDDEPTTVAIL
jgi:hypothetical protein